MVIVFDLDDTLYEEITYVKSGLRAVAQHLSDELAQPWETIYSKLEILLAHKRDYIFNRLLEQEHKYTKTRVQQCVSVYRAHTPVIKLDPQAKACLERLSHHPLYLVTDGNHRVQRKKVEALEIEPYFKRCFYTYSHGVHRSKPSPYCFLKICQMENVEPKQVVYVADNPHKDFVGIKPLGFHTLRIMQGPYRSLVVPPNQDAERHISSLDELTEGLLNDEN